MNKTFYNQNITIRAYHPDWCSHLPVLAKILPLSKGPILEMGMGIFSTPLFHTWCAAEGRFLDSYDDLESWVKIHEEFKTYMHHISYVKDWSKVPIERTHWGIVFIDHASNRRAKDAIRAARYADYVILHDTNGRLNVIYHWEMVYPHFRYRYIFDKIHPHTTVLSNFYKYG